MSAVGVSVSKVEKKCRAQLWKWWYKMVAEYFQWYDACEDGYVMMHEVVAIMGIWSKDVMGPIAGGSKDIHFRWTHAKYFKAKLFNS